MQYMLMPLEQHFDGGLALLPEIRSCGTDRAVLLAS
jgi:hypothetical protein